MRQWRDRYIIHAGQNLLDNEFRYIRTLRVRAAVNCCYNNGHAGPGIHSDHEFEHKQFMLYLNTPEDEDTPTVVYNKEEDEILAKVYPKQFKGACFDGLPHTFKYPKKGLRWVAVFTFT